MLSACLNKIKFRNKLMLLLFFPVLALLFFSTVGIIGKWHRFQNIRSTRLLIHISQNLTDSLHNFRKERGLSAAYFDHLGKRFSIELRTQQGKSDDAITHLSTHHLDVEKDTQEPELIDDLKHLLDLFKKRSDFRGQVALFKNRPEVLSYYEAANQADLTDDLRGLVDLFKKRSDFRQQITLLKNRQEALSYYTAVNQEVLYLVERMGMSMEDAELIKKGRVYSKILWLQEYSGLERDIFNSVISSGEVNEDLLKEVHQYILKQHALLADLKRVAFPEVDQQYIDDLFTGPAESRVERIRQLARTKAEKLERLKRLQELIGYGGMIHHYKNYVLRNDILDFQLFHDAIQKLGKLIYWYQSSPGLSPDERQALADITSTFEAYRGAIITVGALHLRNVSASEIDHMVSISDRSALAALDFLHRKFGEIKVDPWSESATERIGRFKMISDQIGEEIARIAEAEMDKAMNDLILYLIVTVSALSISLMLALLMSKHLVTRINLIIRTLRQTGDYNKYTAVHGQDEVSKIAQSLNHFIKKRRLIKEKLVLATRVFDHASDGIMIVDSDKKILSVNLTVSKTTKYSQEDLIGQTPRLLYSERHNDQFYKEMWDTIDTRGYWEGEIWNKKKNGEVYPAWQNIGAIKDHKGQVINYIVVFSDIKKQKKDESLLHFQAYHDPLTHLPNRMLFFERLTQHLKQLKRSNLKMALLFIDLNRFKRVNDTLGHSAGDTVLKDSAKRLLDSVREADTVARLGGDEFVVILPETDGEKTVSVVADKIIEQLSKPFLVDKHKFFLGASIGITIAPDDGDETSNLLKNADMAMYQSKLTGRNTYHFFSEQMEKLAKARTILERDLKRALEQEELIIHYQPVVDLHSRETISLEALVRWKHPKKGILLPGSFINLAEESDLINQIGEWVLRTACKQVKYWQDHHAYSGSVSVNIASRQIIFGDFQAVLIEALGESRLAPEFLTLEVTESLMLENKKDVINKLRSLKAEGVRIAIDDFGTGASSLSHLSQYPIDHLKIDGSFVHQVVSDHKKQSLVEAIIRMGQSLQIKVVAEGLETSEDLAFVSALGCNTGQGFYFSKPLSVKDYEKVLKKKNR